MSIVKTEGEDLSVMVNANASTNALEEKKLLKEQNRRQGRRRGSSFKLIKVVCLSVNSSVAEKHQRELS